MTFDFGIVKKHPYAIGGTILVIGGLVFYFIVRKSSGSGYDASSSTQEFLQTMSAQQAQAAAYNSQLQIASIQAESNNLAIIKQAETQQAAIAAQRDTQLGVATIQGNTIVGASEIQQQIQQAKLDQADRLQKELLPLVAKHYPGSSTGVVQVVSALQGNGPQALAYTNPGAYAGVGVATPWGSVQVGG